MYLDESARIISTRYGITIFQQKDGKSSQYGDISHNDGNNPSINIQANHITQEYEDNGTLKYSKENDEDPPKYSNLTLFEDDKFIN